MTIGRALELLGNVRGTLALGLLALAAAAARLDLLEDDEVLKILVGGTLFGAAAVIARMTRSLRVVRLSLLAGPMAEFWAAAITVALLERYSDLAPALFLLPLSTLAVVMRQVDAVAFAALAAALLLETRVLRGARLDELLVAAGWTLVFVAWAVVAGRGGAALRRGILPPG